ncbi:DUF1329 domain-containing protein [Pseudomonas umsongensis]|jgi:hypothetical protein|uniref:DUF1329 domain-containing protein n=1 Tax=Pseudomonas umsongensis TaxID=198618 RepID=A0ABX4E090_9PSED|nr:DUF1329 domain-containing protein [Pseudomonas umsongensis]MDP9687507.1 hypothetical protein [Pseudomonas mohnii]MBT9571153.1 DUF1329 domain-containing protein [Pseudomonas umsongensis]MCK8682882.1 DUF1329 domain-containing protein [Pseudomonas umsongensis]OXR35079.1 DUF1329 domain-containing protein [Pseudomonas umsongensis]QFG30248.1 DUF1329 domain-containing protein [Pseudomonas umsongensis]
MKASKIITCAGLALSLLASGVMAAVSEQEAAQLGTSLTPLGAQKEGNADKSIPAWDGGLKPGAAPVDAKGFLGDPFKNEKPLFTITAANAQQYKDKLTPGQLAMFQRYPDTYKIPVYPSHRTAAAPVGIYAAAKKSAVNVQLVNDGTGLANFADSRYYAFPIPKSGVEVYWNFVTRFRGENVERWSVQAVPQVNGDYTIVETHDQNSFPQYMEGVDLQAEKNILYYYIFAVDAPARLAGTVSMAHETIDQVTEPRKAWTYNAGQRRVRRAPQLAYDAPGLASDGMRTSDNADMMNGSPDRYDWKLIGKKEMYIPYNNYKLQSPNLKYADIIKPGHINQDLTRYELHRVWHVQATLKAGERHIYAKRDMYFDEDTWVLSEVDHYDGRGQLWRVGENYTYNNYEKSLNAPAAQGFYDLLAGRYIVATMSNEAKSAPQYGARTKLADFTPAALRNAGIR